MKIQNVSIFGFGRWVDYTIDFSDTSFICFYGENESGKTTLQQFILFVLFGLTPKERTLYQPKTSSKLGGRLTVENTSVGRFTIERIDGINNGAATCITADGSVHGEAWLNEQLNGLTREAYESIYSFSSLDLLTIREMNHEDLSEILLSIGLTGATNVYMVEKQLNQKLGELFKPAGRIPKINQQLQEIDELYVKWSHYKKNEATYQKKKNKALSLQDKIKHLQNNLKHAREKLIILDRQQHAITVVQAFHQAQEELKNLPKTLPFPEDGIKRYQLIKDKLLPLQSELAVLKDNESKFYQAEKNEREQKCDFSIDQKAQEFLKKYQTYLLHHKESEQIDQKINTLKTQIQEKTSTLNLDLTLDELMTYSFPFHIEQMWQQLKENSEHLKAEKERLFEEEKIWLKQKEALINEQTELENKLLSNEQVNQLERIVYQYEEENIAKKLNKVAKQKQHQWASLKEKKLTRTKRTLLIHIGLAVMFALFYFFVDKPLFLLVASLLLLIGVGQNIWVRRSLDEMEPFIERDQENKGLTHSKENLLKQKEEAEKLLNKHSEYKNMLATVINEKKSLHIQLLQWDEKKNALLQRESRIANEIEQQYYHYPFLNDVNIAYWLELLQLLREIQLKAKEIDHLYQLNDGLTKKKITFQKEVSNFLQSQKIKGKIDAIQQQMELIEKFVDDQNDIRRSLQQYKQLLAENKEQQQTLLSKIKTYSAEIDALFKEARVNTENDYFKIAKQLAEKERLQETIENQLNQLSAMFPTEVKNELIENNLHESTLKLSIKESQESITRLENEIENARKQLADITAQLQQMESSEEHSETMHRLEMEREQLNYLAREWAVYKTAKEVLEETKHAYRDKYLVEVINKTSTYFNTITDGAYTRVFTTNEKGVFQVEAEDVTHYDVNELSQGTIDQLYISLRLAISDVMSEKHDVPFIMDDAFVHFDSLRIKRMIKILNQIAKRQQVILLTCKKDVIKEIDREQVISLNHSDERVTKMIVFDTN